MLLERADQAISSTDLQKNSRLLLDRIASQEQDRYVVMRDNRPTAVMMSTAHYEALMDELDDLRIEAVARERFSSIEQVNLISHADMLKRIGETEDKNMSIRAFKNIWPTQGFGTYIDQDAVVIGDVHLGEHCSVWPGAVIRGDVNSIRIGDYTNIQDNSVLHTTHQNDLNPGAPLSIGHYVTVGHAVVLHGCTIQDFCLIGMQSIVLDNAVIEPYVIIGAGSVVSPGKRLESGYLYLGSPARKVRALTDQERTFLKYSAEHYAKLKDEYLTA